MENNEMMPSNDTIKQELLEILNHPEILDRFNDLFQKYRLLENKNLTIEFKFVEEMQVRSAGVLSVENESLSASSQSVQFGSTWCPYPACTPPPGKFI
jgi:hypothetical protein